LTVSNGDPGRAARLVLFDIDGTLVHAAGVGRAAIEGAMIEVYGTPGPIDDLPFDGMTDPQIVRTLLRAEGLSEAEIAPEFERLWPAYAARLEGEIDERRERMRPTPGVPEILDALEAEGTTLGLLTGNIVAGAEGKLSAVGLWGRFPFGAFGCDDADRNRLPPIALERAFRHTGTRYGPGRTWIIGDTPHDIECARGSGLSVLGVATGRFSVDDLRRAGADEALPDLRDTRRVMSVLASA